MDSSAEKKLTLPNIQPTATKALPSSQQTLPSLQPTEKLSLSSISLKVKKTPTRPKSSGKRILPSIPLVENGVLPCIKANVAASRSVNQLLPTLPSFRRQDASLTEKPQIKVKPAVKRLQTTTDGPFSPQNVLVEKKFSRTSSASGTQSSEGQGEALSRLQRPMENIPSKPLQKQSRRSRTATEKEAITNVKPRKDETPLNSQLKPGGYAFLNLKRREFEELQRLRHVAKRHRAKAGQSCGILTVKPALPGIQSEQENVTEPRPPPSQPMIKKASLSAHPSEKQRQSNWRTKAWRNPPSLQPVKQVLPSLSSSHLNTAVKQPLPSVQPEGNHTVREQDFQTMVTGRKKISQTIHLSEDERQ